MRVLITGGAGCLGANIADRLFARGDDIAVIDNFATSQRQAPPPDGVRFRVVEASVADAAAIDGAFAAFGPDIVIHAAASYKNPDDWRGDLATNALGTINVVEAARRAGAKRFVYLQTALCYGRPDATPIPVTAPLRPFTSYGVSKTAGEAYALMSGLNVISLRLANVTGPRLSIGPIPTFYQRLKAGKPCFCTDATRDFLDMDDFLEFVDLAIKPDAPKGAFNISTGEGRSIREVFDGVAAYLGLSPDAPPLVPPGTDDIALVVLDPAETEKSFGWRARISFSESLNRMLGWYDVYGVREIHAHVGAPGGRP